MYTFEGHLQEVADLLEGQLGKEFTVGYLMKSTYFSVYRLEVK